MEKRRRNRLKAKQKNSSKRLKTASERFIAGQEDDSHPNFCLRFLDPKREFNPCSKEDRAALAATMVKLSGLTWKQIALSGRHQCGYEWIGVAQLKRSMPPVFSEDIEKVMVFRFAGMKAMAGLRNGSVFHIVFLDSNFSLYDHG